VRVTTRLPVRERRSRGTRPLRVARMLALAYRMQRMLDTGRARTRDDLAAMTGFSGPRICQLLDLTLLAPDIQEALAFHEHASGDDPVHEKALRRVVREASWEKQRALWRGMRKEQAT
jgi:hypothetical protein